jgi:hypothetical protein
VASVSEFGVFATVLAFDAALIAARAELVMEWWRRRKR